MNEGTKQMCVWNGNYSISTLNNNDMGQQIYSYTHQGLMNIHAKKSDINDSGTWNIITMIL